MPAALLNSRPINGKFFFIRTGGVHWHFFLPTPVACEGTLAGEGKITIKLQKSMERILIVNNDIDTMELLKKWLEKKTYTVKYTTDNREFLHVLQEFDPALVIVDAPQWEVIHEIRSQENQKRIAVLLMTGYNLNTDLRNLPFDDVVEKPFDLPLFHEKIERLLKANLVRQ